MTVDVQNLIKRYGEHFTLDIPTLHLASGETIGLVGNNGAGKTTFLRLLLDLIQADGGSILVNNENVAEGAAWKASVGSYLDESFLIDFLTPEEFFDFVGHIYHLTQEQISEAVSPYVPFVPEDVLGANPPYIRDLSTGNKKKIGIVAALMMTPQLLILDEPFANLDPGSQFRLKAILRTLRDEHGTTMVISSHDLVHVTDICERIVLVGEGRIVRDTATSEATLRELEHYFASQD